MVFRFNNPNFIPAGHYDFPYSIKRFASTHALLCGVLCRATHSEFYLQQIRPNDLLLTLSLTLSLVFTYLISLTCSLSLVCMACAFAFEHVR